MRFQRLLKTLIGSIPNQDEAIISHDLKVVKSLCHSVMVMKGGGVVEQGDARAIFNRPQSGYTRTLLETVFA